MLEGEPRRIEHESQENLAYTIENEPLLKRLFSDEVGKEGGDLITEYEIERRYEPAKLLSADALLTLSSRDIKQTHLNVVDNAGTVHSVRLRETFQEGPEGTLFRLAKKTKKKGARGKIEKQIRFPPADSDSRTGDFKRFWENENVRTLILEKKRYYIPHQLPNGHMCEIHYDVHPGEKLGGFVRIEIEFQNDKDEQYVLENRGKKGILPSWVGKDVTEDPDYRAKALAVNGVPKEVLEAQKKLRVTDRL